MSSRGKREAIGVKQPGGVIIWATDGDREIINTIKNGHPVKVTRMRTERNLKFHRKAFALINLGFEYWIPAWAFVSQAEKWVAHKVASEIGRLAGDPSLYANVTKAIADDVVQQLSIERAKKFDPNVLKTVEAFRSEMLIKAGLFDVVSAAGGGTRKEPRSMSFANMNAEAFEDCYKRLFGAIWNEVLFQHFADEQECQNMINQLSEFVR